MEKILYGKEVSDNIDYEINLRTQELRAIGIVPKIAIVRVGENPGDMYYEKAALKKAEKLGIDSESIVMNKDVTQDELMGAINLLNEDKSVHGVLLLRPFPKHMDDDLIRNTLSPDKDIDGITDGSIMGIVANTNRGFTPCTPRACMEILKYYGYELVGKNVTVIGRSLVIGKPLSLLLTNANANVTVCHSRTMDEDLKAYCKASDIVVLATGKTESFNSDYLTEDTIIIDVGTGVGKDGKMAGDLDYEEVEGSGLKNLYVTPVPKGLGSVTTSVLMKNLIEAVKNPD